MSLQRMRRHGLLLMLICFCFVVVFPSSHPDIVIGLTILSFRFRGLRRSDFTTLLKAMQESLHDEVGPYNLRPSSKLFADWVKLAGGHVRGSTLEQASVRLRKKQQLKADEKQIQKLLELQWIQQQQQLEIRQARKASSTASMADVTAETVGGRKGTNATASSATDAPKSDAASEAAAAIAAAAAAAPATSQRSYASDKEVWPLRLIDVDDEEQFQLVFNLLHALPELVYHFLRHFIFPQTLRHQGLKLSASGQDVGGDMLSNHRVGFSGTPSDLLPLELGSCQYEQGSDGAMLHTLCDPSICSVLFIQSDWSVLSLLNMIATGGYHALIDTGALITGMSNLDVAHHLLQNGLEAFEGVVFLDESDRKMILLRRSRKVIPLAACGIPLVKRFWSVQHNTYTAGQGISAGKTRS